MPSLITFEEALSLGELTDHQEIGDLVERAWAVRRENFGDSTDMCSLVNAKSGGCAEDCGFCAQSRYAEADTPMHAMMEPDQILEHAKAAEAAGAHRFCMVTQGQGLSKRDFANIVEGAKLVSEHTNLKRCASIGHMSAERAKSLREAGIQRVHHNVESARSYYPEVSTTVRYEGRLRTIQAVKEAGLETCVGGILNLGETPEQRADRVCKPDYDGPARSFLDPFTRKLCRTSVLDNGRTIFESLIHNLPRAMFIFLPALAVLMMLRILSASTVSLCSPATFAQAIK